MLFKSYYLGDGIYHIEDILGANMYLVIGKSNAMLIDTGMGIGSLREYVESITEKQLIVVNTHGHPGHAGGNGEFSAVYMHPNDKELYYKMSSTQSKIRDLKEVFHLDDEVCLKMIEFKDNTMPINDIQCIDLGERIIDIVLLPGHTEGSLCLYDRNSGTLFSGDTINGDETWLHHDYSASLQIYYLSLRMMLKNGWNIKQVCPADAPTPVNPEIIENLEMCVRRILLHDAKGVPFQTHTGEGYRYSYSGTTILYNPQKIYENRSYDD